jgi:hypothetical protein
MASFSRSFKPSFLSPRMHRPGMTGRSLSQSSDLSVASSTGSSKSEDQFAISFANTPLDEHGPPPTSNDGMSTARPAAAGSQSSKGGE